MEKPLTKLFYEANIIIFINSSKIIKHNLFDYIVIVNYVKWNINFQ